MWIQCGCRWFSGIRQERRQPYVTPIFLNSSRVQPSSAAASIHIMCVKPPPQDRHRFGLSHYAAHTLRCGCLLTRIGPTTSRRATCSLTTTHCSACSGAC